MGHANVSHGACCGHATRMSDLLADDVSCQEMALQCLALLIIGYVLERIAGWPQSGCVPVPAFGRVGDACYCYPGAGEVIYVGLGVHGSAPAGGILVR